MANVIFKRGLQNNLDAIAKNDGVFYLTTDTGRLYVDIDNDRKLLNQTVQFIDSLQSLITKSTAWSSAEKTAHVNDIYYITGANILAVFTNGAENGGWVQINPDTDTYIGSTDMAVGDIQNNGSTISLTIRDQDGGNTTTATFGVTGAGGITLSKSGNNLVITGETYTLDTSVNNAGDEASIMLLDSSTTAVSTKKLVAGDSNIAFETVSSGIKITTQNTTLGATSTSVTLPSAGSLSVSVIDTDGNGNTSTLSNVGVILNDNTYVPIDSTEGKNAGAIYSKAEIDTMMNGLDGMTFKGTYGSSGATISTLPTTNVKNGDTYVIVEQGLTASDFTGITVNLIGEMAGGTRVGDMLIAKGTEGSDGKISSNLEWTYIPSGNDELDAVTYHGIANTASHSLTIENGPGVEIAKLDLDAGDGITLTSVASTTASLATTIAHSVYSTTSTTAASASEYTDSFTAIKGLTITNGHVTAIETDTFTPVVYHLTGATATQSASFGATNTGTNTVEVGVGITDSNGTSNLAGATMNLTSSSLKMTAGSNGSVAVNIEWGTFGA